MFVGNVCYVTSCYNECKFQLLLENHLSKKKGARLSDGLIEQSIAAYLECKDSDFQSKEVSRMETFLDDLGIKYADYRSYGTEVLEGKPIDAVKAFNQLANDFKKTLAATER